MKRLGIIQPGKIGDIIICLPIAKYYADVGYEVIWPIDETIINHFLGYIDYVKFIPINFDCREARLMCADTHCNTIIDLSFSIPGANQFNNESYQKQIEYSFDEFKYYLANVPFEEKWNLHLNRNLRNEEDLKFALNIKKPYVVIQENSSDCIRKVDWANPLVRRVNISNVTKSVFDWIGVLEDAEQHVLIESCFSNLVDQLNIKVDKQTLLMKNGYYGKPLADSRLRGEPVLKLDWNKL